MTEPSDLHVNFSVLNKTESDTSSINDDFIQNKLELLKLNENRSIASLYYLKSRKHRNEHEGFYEEEDQINGRRIRNIALKMTERIKRF
jgi:hypothetical protein